MIFYLSWEAEGHGDKAIVTDPGGVEGGSSGGIKASPTKKFTNNIKDENENENDDSDDNNRSPSNGLDTNGGGYQRR